MKTFKFKKGVYIVNPNYLRGVCDSYKYEIYIEKDRNDVKTKYDNCHGVSLQKNGLESTIQDVTLLRICQVLEKLKYMEKSHYFNIQDIAVLNWLESEFKQFLKEQEGSEVEKSVEEKRKIKKTIKKETKNDRKNNN